MRLMSFAATVPQMRARTKTVTRRLGWCTLRPGDRLLACEKTGVRVEDRVELGVIEVVDVRREPIEAIQDHDSIIEDAEHRIRHGIECDEELRNAECTAEGFPGLSGCEFIDAFCRINGVIGKDVVEVTRIEFRFVQVCRDCGEAT